MANENITKVKIGKFSVGVVGLKAALEGVTHKEFSSDEEIADHLLQVLKKKNYIPPKSEPEHARAFLREYKKFRGEPFEVEEPQGLEVKILGNGDVYIRAKDPDYAVPGPDEGQRFVDN